MRRLTLWRRCTRIAHRCTRRDRGSGGKPGNGGIAGMQSEFWGVNANWSLGSRWYLIWVNQKCTGTEQAPAETEPAPAGTEPASSRHRRGPRWHGNRACNGYDRAMTEPAPCRHWREPAGTESTLAKWWGGLPQILRLVEHACARAGPPPSRPPPLAGGPGGVGRKTLCVWACEQV